MDFRAVTLQSPCSADASPLVEILYCPVLDPVGVTAEATHIVGGEISYEDLGDGAYRIRLVVYRDCGPTNQNGTGFDDAASVGIFNANGQLVNSISIPLSSKTSTKSR